MKLSYIESDKKEDFSNFDCLVPVEDGYEEKVAWLFITNQTRGGFLFKLYHYE